MSDPLIALAGLSRSNRAISWRGWHISSSGSMSGTVFSVHRTGEPAPRRTWRFKSKRQVAAFLREQAS